LNDLANSVQKADVIPYSELPGFPVAKVSGHAGNLVAGLLGGKEVAVLQGRSHPYESGNAAAMRPAIEMLKGAGIGTLILTNAAGGINTAFARGALMLIDDHINLMGSNPLAGPNDDRFGPRFPDMTEVYSSRLRYIAEDAARTRGIALSRGVYVAVQGPSYETPAEIRAFRAIGADAVGMSTVPEAIAARHMGIEVLGISCITNMAAGVLPQPLVHEDVIATAREVRGSFLGLLDGIFERL